MADNRSLGVASSKADIDGGTITGVTLTATSATLASPTLTSPAIASAAMTGANSATTLIVSSTAAFFSVTAAIAQPSGAAQGAVATDVAQTISGSNFGFTSAQANGIITLLNKIRADLVALGKAVCLCTDNVSPCWKKFDAKAENYVLSRTVPMVRGRCDGCGQHSNMARMYLSAKQPGVI